MEKEVTKPFSINHQKVTLDFEFSSRTIFASTEIQIYLNTKEIPFLRLHSKKCEIHSVTVNDKNVLFEIFDPCVQLCQTDEVSKGNCSVTLLQKVFDFARAGADQGELAIEIPKEINLEDHLAPELATKKEDSDKTEVEEKKTTTPLIIKIEYSITEPDTGLMFSSNYRVNNNQGSSYLYTLNQQGPGDARCWVPSRDDAHEKCTWELDFIVSQGTESEEETGFSVVASGHLVSQERLPLDSSRSLVHYFIPFPCPAYLVSFAVGKFDSLLITEMDNYQNEQTFQENEDTELSKKVMAYSPLGWKEELRNSCQAVEKIMDFYINEFGSYPNDSVKLVFLPTSNMPLIVGAEVSMLSLEFLHSEDIIDQTFETRRLIALAIASQWFGISVVPKTSPDIWMVLGLSGFMTSLFLKSTFGQNEYRYRMKHDMLQIAHLDVNRPPLYNSRLTNPFDPEDLNFIRLKSTFVLYMLDKQMLKGAASAGLHRMIQKVLISAMCGELGSGNTLSTHWFLKTCRKLSGVDLKGFSEQWIYCSGCPTFTFSYSFNRKKMVVEIDVKQSNTNAGITDDPHLSLEAIKPAKFFSGHMTASIREPDGTPYEHVLDIQEDVTRFEVQFNTKYKRIRRSTKRFQKRKAEAAAAEAIVKDQLDGDNADNDDLFLTEEGKEKEKEDWRIVEWGEADEESLESATFEWIRLDSDFEWICLIDLDQPDYMWAGQLEKDRDVVSQYEAVQALKKFPSQATSTTLLRTVMNTQCFYRIRADAADALVYCSLEQLNYIGRHHLLRIFHKKYCIDEQEDEQHPENFLLRPNDFTNLSEYFVQKAVILAISNLDKDSSDPISHKLLSNLLVNNDNSNNTYSDCYFICTMITALGNALDTPSSTRQGKTVQVLVDELKRYSTMDYLIPSYQNVITVSCLQTYTKLFIRGTIKPDLILLLTHSRYGNFIHVRMAAFDGLLLLGALLIPAIRAYLFNTMESDPDYYLRYYITSNITKMCAIYQGKAVEKECGLNNGHDTFGLNSLDGLSNNQHGYTITKWSQFRDSHECQQIIRRMLANSSLDHRVRNNLYILCRILYTEASAEPCNFAAFQIRVCEPSSLIPKILPPEIVVENSKSKVDVVLPGIDNNKAKSGTGDSQLPDAAPLMIKMKIPKEEPLASEKTLSNETLKGKKNAERVPKAVKDTASSVTIKIPSPRIKIKEIEKPPSKLSSSKDSNRRTIPSGKGLADADAASAKKLLIKLVEHDFGPHLAGKKAKDTLATDPVDEHPVTIRKIRGRLSHGKYPTLSSIQMDIDKMFSACFQLHGSDETLARGLKELHEFYSKEARHILGWVVGPLVVESALETKKQPASVEEEKVPTKVDRDPIQEKDLPDLPQKSLSTTSRTTSNTTPRPISIHDAKTNSSEGTLTSVPDPIPPIPIKETSSKTTGIVKSSTPSAPTSRSNSDQSASQAQVRTPKDASHVRVREPSLVVSPRKRSPSRKSQRSPGHKKTARIDTPSGKPLQAFSNSPSRSPFQASFGSPQSPSESLRENRFSPSASTSRIHESSKKTQRTKFPNTKHIPESPLRSPIHHSSRNRSPPRTSLKLTIRPPRPLDDQRSVPKSPLSPITNYKSRSPHVRRSPIYEPTRTVSRVPPVSRSSRNLESFDEDPERSRRPTSRHRVSSRDEPQFHDRRGKDVASQPTKLIIRPPRTPSPLKNRKEPKRDFHPESPPRINTRPKHLEPISNRIPSPQEAPDTVGFYRSDDYFISKALLKTLMESEEAQPFVHPVDMIPDGSSIEEPGGLRVIRVRLKKNLYSSLEEMKNDITEIFSQCLKAMDRHSDMYRLARSSKKHFLQSWEEAFPSRKRVLSEDEAMEFNPSPKRRDTSKAHPKINIKLPGSSPFTEPVPITRHDDVNINTKHDRGSSHKIKHKDTPLSISPRVEKHHKYKSEAISSESNSRSSKHKGVTSNISHREKEKDPLSEYHKDIPSPSPKNQTQKVLASPVTKLKERIDASPSTKLRDQPFLSPSRKRSSTKPIDKSKSTHDYCDLILKKLDEHPSSPCFREPVDPVLLAIPNYFEIITHPMDLGTVRSRFDAREYKDFGEFDHDVRLIVRNACRFNPPGTWVFSEAQRLEDYYDTLIADFDGTFLTKEDVSKLVGIMERFRKEEFGNTFTSPTKYGQYLESPNDLISLITCLKANKFVHIGEFEAAIQKLLHVCFSFFSPSDIEYKDTLLFEKSYVKYFERSFDRKSVMGQVSLQEPLILMTPDLKNQCLQVLKKLTNLKASQHFLAPVDYKKLRLPHYPKLIKRPMDLGTVGKKLNSGAYHTIDEFESDVLLVCYNCYNFNGMGSFISDEADKVKEAFSRDWGAIKKQLSQQTKVDSRKLTQPTRPASKSTSVKHSSKPVVKSPEPLPALSAHNRQLINDALAEIRKHPHYEIFGEPVDPVALGIPTYFDKIKNPMDFGTIQNKHKKGSYDTVKAFLDDANQVFVNCFIFNYSEDPVFIMGKEIEAAWKSICNKKGLVEDSGSPASISIVSPKGANRSSHSKARDNPKEDDRSRKRPGDSRSKTKPRR